MLLQVPLGYAKTFAELTSLAECHGGSPWGAGTLAGDGTRQPSKLELSIAKTQGEYFYKTLAKAFP